MDGSIVHIIEDDASMQTALEALFRSVGLATRAYASAREFLEAKQYDTVGCLVMDVRLPGISGLDFQEQLSAHGVNLPVVMMTAHGDIPMSVRAMKAGAIDFLPKPFREQDMLAVTAAIERDRSRRVTSERTAGLHERFATLSPREREVILLVATGKMNKQIAGDLGITEITVKIHRGAAMRMVPFDAEPRQLLQLLNQTPVATMSKRSYTSR